MPAACFFLAGLNAGMSRNALGALGSEDFAGESPGEAMPAAAGPGASGDPVETVTSGPRVLPA